jgi:uncharacterized protein involved in outer membrane biogenesis
MKKVLKYTFLALLGGVLLIVIAVPFIPADSYRDNINTRLSDLLGMQVLLGDISLTSLPVPGIQVENIQLSRDNHTLATIDRLHIAPRLSSLLSTPREVRKIHLTGLRLNAIHFDQLSLLLNQQTPAGPSNLPAIVIKRVVGDHSLIQLKDNQTLGPFQFDMQLSDSMRPERFDFSLEAQTLKLALSADHDSYLVQLQATDWTPPLTPKLHIDSLQASGKLHTDRLLVERINLSAYRGEANGNLLVDWQDQWKLDSRVQFTSVNLKQLLKSLNQDSMAGNTAGKLTLRSVSDEPATLVDNLKITGDLVVTDGYLYKTDLESAVTSLSADWLSGGQTPFDSLQSRLDANKDRIRLSGLQLLSPLISAQGKLDIIRLNRLDGRITVGLNDPTGAISMPLMVAGTFNEPMVRPTDEALAGGSIGTAILGPGVGTAIGIKAGEFIGNIGKFFGSHDEEKQDKDNED